jgi:hypothetical protein
MARITIDRWIVGLVALIGGLVALAAAAGVFLRGDLATAPFTTVRGDVVDVLTGGIYRFNGEAVAAEGVGWDLVTLCVVVPVLLLTLPALARSSTRALLLTCGILTYFLYQYAEYAMFLAFGPLFLLYVAIFALSLSGLAVLLGRLDLATLAASVSGPFPRRGAAGFGAFMAILLAGMWLPLVLRSAGDTQVPALGAATTLVVQAFDLGFLVPLGIFTAVTVWRRLPVGYVLAAIVVVKGAAMGAGIAAMLVVEARVTGVLQLPPILLFAAISATAVVLGFRVYRSIGEGASTVTAVPAGSAGVREPTRT